MGELWVTMNEGQPDEVTLPFSQAASVAKCIDRVNRVLGRQAVWHRNDCGCCFAVHVAAEEGEHVHSGYIVDSRGGIDWVTSGEDGVTWHGDIDPLPE